MSQVKLKAAVLDGLYFTPLAAEESSADLLFWAQLEISEPFAPRCNAGTLRDTAKSFPATLYPGWCFVGNLGEPIACGRMK